jgi:hypothetical protein
VELVDAAVVDRRPHDPGELGLAVADQLREGGIDLRERPSSARVASAVSTSSKPGAARAPRPRPPS